MLIRIVATGAVRNVLQPTGADSLDVYGVGPSARRRSPWPATTESARWSPSTFSPSGWRPLPDSAPSPSTPPNWVGTTLVDKVRAVTGGGASRVIDTTGVAEVIRAAVLAMRPRGRAVLLGLGAAEISLDAVDLMMNGKVSYWAASRGTVIRRR